MIVAMTMAQVIEYVGELVRHLVGDARDDKALEKGKSTYMFRIDEVPDPFRVQGFRVKVVGFRGFRVESSGLRVLRGHRGWSYDEIRR
eukprot:2104621-Rhodomonas_salina.3